MRREYFRYCSIFVIITCVFALLVSCGSTGGGDDGGGDSVASIMLSASLESIPANGVSSSAITATIIDASGNSVAGGTSVTFSTTLGAFSNGSATCTEKTPDDAEVDPTGIVVVSLIAGTTPGVAKVTVKCSGVTQLISIEFSYAGATGMPVAEEFGLVASFVNISGLWITELQDTITASVGDFYGNAAQDNTLIFFKTYNTGGILDPDKDWTSGGFASSTLYSTSSPTPMQGFVSLTAEITGGPTTRVTSLAVTPSDNHIMYAGTNGGGVYKSTDSGNTWENISRSSENPKQGQNWINPYIKGHSALSVDPDDPDTVYVGTGYLGKGNVYRSLNGGMTWNSNNFEEWNGLYATTDAVLTVLCDGDDTATDYPYVWIGTEGRGILYAVDGENFQPSGGTVTTPVLDTSASGSNANGAMAKPILSYSSNTETWTATCLVPSDASATVPDPGGDDDNQGDGWMSNVATSLATKTEDWTVQYKMTAGNVINEGTGDGSVVDINVTKPNGPSEEWTLTCTSGSVVIGDVEGTAISKGTVRGISVTGGPTETFTLTCTTGGSEDATFSVVSDKRGSFGTATSDASSWTSTDQTGVTLTITSATAPDLYDAGDIFTFTITNPTTTFSVYSDLIGYYPDATVGTAYENNALSFQINQGSIPFEVHDTLTFTTTTYWQVSGTVSGVQIKTATTGAYYTSDNGEVDFTISAGSLPFAIGDKFTFSTTGVSAPFWMVEGEGNVSGVQWKWAENNVPYTSDNYEVSFTIYEGAIPFADGDTFTFSVTANTLGHGRTVWDIVKVPDTHGPTAILYAAAATGVFKSVNGGQTWNEPGSFTGDFITTLALHSSSTGAGNDIIYAGTLNAGVWVSTDSGAIWTQYPNGMEMGQSATIKDILVDPMNDRLYAITIQGTPDQALGNVYTHAVNADGSMVATGQWSEANTGLAGVGLHVMASDNPINPGALFTGGEGINLYKATGGGLTTGAPAWQVSKSGLTNLIMARTPILFSGGCGLDASYWEYESTWYFTVYVQDINGNPPIAGSTFKAELGDSVFFDITYGDCYTHQGTFSDQSNPSTNNPYRFAFSPEPDADEELTIKFTSADTRLEDPNTPGYSGAGQTLTYQF